MSEQFKKSGETPVASGKTKEIWAVEGEDKLVIMKNTDATTADNDASKTQIMVDKGKCATITTSRVFELLQQAGIPTAYVQQLSDTEVLAKKCIMIPLEVIIRRHADGSSLDRMPQLKREGPIPYRFHQLKFELFLKTSKGILEAINLRNYIPNTHDRLIRYLNAEKTLKDVRERRKKEDKSAPLLVDLYELSKEELIEEVIKTIDDPWIENPYDLDNWVLRHPKKPTWEIPLLTNGPAIIDAEKLKEIEDITRKTFLVLEGAWKTLGYRLIDFKIEFGIDADGSLVVADVIDNDSWRLRTDDWKELSKQNFRDGHPLKDVQEDYVGVAQLISQITIPKQAIIFWRGSKDDKLEDFSAVPGIAKEDIVISGHKSPQAAIDTLNELHAKYPEGAVIIAIVGMSNGLGPMLSARTPWPVLSYCNTTSTNPEDVWSNLRMPSQVPNATFLSIKNAHLFALNILSMRNPIAYMERELAIEKWGN